MVAGARFRVLRQTGPGRQAQTGRPRQAEAAEKNKQTAKAIVVLDVQIYQMFRKVESS